MGRVRPTASRHTGGTVPSAIVLPPGRIWKNMGMPGHLGDERVTVQNLQVMQVREAEKIILVSGAVPGSNGCYVVVRPAIKKRGAATPPSRSASPKSGGEGAAAAPTK